ncbi:helix-turn-helix domain-containing protein [Sphaerotilaceae bacterium SBD11-9]
MLLTRRPIAPLAGFVDTLWASERGAMPHAREINLPTGRADIVIPLLEGQTLTRFADAGDAQGQRFAGGVLHGAQDRATVRATHGASAVVGVHFKPGGAAAFFGGALPALRNRTVLLDELWGASALALRADLQAANGPHARLLRLEACLVARLRYAAPADAMVAATLQSMARQPQAATIEALQRASGCGPTQFIARFERTVGLTPKRYARVLRFHAMVMRLAGQAPHDWAHAAADAGYADQSHLVHEFKRLAGITPSAYRAIAPDHPTHVALIETPSEKISKTH